jgi:hypothetical protein
LKEVIEDELQEFGPKNPLPKFGKTDCWRWKHDIFG